MWRGIPRIAWDAAAPLGTALCRSTGSAERLIRDGLILRHRLPRHWVQVVNGTIEAFRARRVADLVAGCPDDICAYIDEHVAPIAATAGVVTLDRMLDEAWLVLHADQVELDRLEALDARHVTIDEASINHTGVADLAARADWADLSAFDASVAMVAAKLAEEDEANGLPPESLDVRRARALGILADPARAKALLDGGPTPRATRRTDLLLHLGADALDGRAFFGRDGRLDKTLLADAIRDWCGRADANLHVHPRHRPECPREDGLPPAHGRDERPDRAQAARSASSPGALVPPVGATRTIGCPTTTAGRPATATSPRCAGDIIGSRRTAVSATRSSSPAPGSGGRRTGSS